MAKKMKHVGIIAEDISDVSVIKVLIEKASNSNIKVTKFVGNGCGKIAGKCGAWSRELAGAGCKILFIVHDLDRRKLTDLRKDLHQALGKCPIEKHLIVIPVKELEAWLIADEMAINRTFKLQKAMKRVANPESINDPKKTLADFVYRNSGKTARYINTIHNEKIAQAANCDRMRRCGSFGNFEKFVLTNFR